MEKERNEGLKDPFEDDELDETIAAADDTGMIAQQQQIVKEETETE